MTRLKRGEEITGESEVFVGRMQHVTRRLGGSGADDEIHVGLKRVGCLSGEVGTHVMG